MINNLNNMKKKTENAQIFSGFALIVTIVLFMIINILICLMFITDNADTSTGFMFVGNLILALIAFLNYKALVNANKLKEDLERM